MLDDDIPFLVTNLPTAELVKVAANAFLATKISFINAVAEVCEVTSADVTTLADAIGCDDRIGRRFLDAGLGFGGGCLSKDIRAFMTRAGELGVGDSLTFLREVDSLNIRRRSRIVEITREECGSLVGARVAILGSSFKPNTDDIRDSPALDVADQIQLEGANVTVYDPKAADNSRKVFPTLNYGFSRRRFRCWSRRGACSHRVGRVPENATARTCRRYEVEVHHRRAQLPRSAHMARSGLDLSRFRVSVTT